MSNLDNLISKIEKDGEDKSNAIFKNAKDEADNIIASKIKEANAERDRILSEAKAEAAITKSQIISGKTLEVRDGKLSAKQAIIDKVFGASIKKLNALSQDEYTRFLENYLLSMDIEGNEQLILPSSLVDTNIEGINNKLKGKGVKGKLSVQRDGKEISGGFILIKDGIENNNTFEALIDYYREDLEGIVVDSLF